MVTGNVQMGFWSLAIFGASFSQLTGLSEVGAGGLGGSDDVGELVWAVHGRHALEKRTSRNPRRSFMIGSPLRNEKIVHL
jgi:hypothetical protein